MRDAGDAILERQTIGPLILMDRTETVAPTVLLDGRGVAAVTVTPASLTTTVGATAQLSAQALDANGTVITGRPFIRTSSAPAIATVGADGRVAGLAVGSATITATTDGISGTAQLNVVTVPAAGSLTCGRVVTASIDAADETDVLTFAGLSGQSVVLTLVQTAGFGLGIGARATVLDPAGNTVVQFSSNTQRTLTLSGTGTFTVRVTATNLVATATAASAWNACMRRRSSMRPLCTVRSTRAI